jgi:hypothetical protein
MVLVLRDANGSWRVHRYREDGQLSETEVTDSNGSSTTTWLDTNGHITRREQRLPNNGGRGIIVYGPNGLSRVAECALDPQGRVRSIVSFMNGRRASEVTYDTNGNPVSRVVYTNGRPVAGTLTNIRNAQTAARDLRLLP